jgi:hypothetical protein
LVTAGLLKITLWHLALNPACMGSTDLKSGHDCLYRASKVWVLQQMADQISFLLEPVRLAQRYEWIGRESGEKTGNSVNRYGIRLWKQAQCPISEV